MRWGDVARPGGPREDTLFEVQTPDGSPWLRVGRVGSAYALHFIGISTFFVSNRGASITCHPVQGVSSGMVAQLLVSQVIPRVISLFEAPTLHGSAVATPFGAIVFLGDTGEGKSTLAAALACNGFPLIGDDCVRVCAREGAFWVVPSSTPARLWPDTATALFADTRGLESVWPEGEKVLAPDGHQSLVLAHRRTPLARILTLRWAPPDEASVKFSAVGRQGAFHAVAKALFRLDPFDRSLLMREFAFISEIVRSVPFEAINVPRSFSRLPEVVGRIRDKIASVPLP